MMSYFLIILNALLLVTGQTLLKLGVNSLGKVELSFWGAIKIIFNPYIFSGLSLYFFTTFLWMYILSKVDLTIAYPMQSIAFIFALFIGHHIFGEIITPVKVLGVGVIMLGVVLITR